MTYEDYLIYSSELQHAWFKKDHKYFKKDKNRYFYSQREWDAYIRNLRGGAKKTADRFKKSATKQISKFQRSAKKTFREAKRSVSRAGASLSRAAKQAAVSAKRISQNFSRKMSELKTVASAKIAKGKAMADIAFANVRGQMRRFNDKVVKLGRAKLESAARRIGVRTQTTMTDLRTHFSRMGVLGRQAVGEADYEKFRRKAIDAVNRRYSSR